MSIAPPRDRTLPVSDDELGFQKDEAATKLLWLTLRNVLTRSVRTTFHWMRAMNDLAILYDERFTLVEG